MNAFFARKYSLLRINQRHHGLRFISLYKDAAHAVRPPVPPLAIRARSRCRGRHSSLIHPLSRLQRSDPRGRIAPPVSMCDLDGTDPPAVPAKHIRAPRRSAARGRHHHLAVGLQLLRGKKERHNLSHPQSCTTPRAESPTRMSRGCGRVAALAALLRYTVFVRARTVCARRRCGKKSASPRRKPLLQLSWRRDHRASRRRSLNRVLPRVLKVQLPLVSR